MTIRVTKEALIALGIRLRYARDIASAERVLGGIAANDARLSSHVTVPMSSSAYRLEMVEKELNAGIAEVDDLLREAK